MNNPLGYFVLFVAALAGVIVSLCDPILVSDRNQFLKGFVDADLLNILGVIFAITAASASNIHLELRRLEAMYQTPDAFLRTRREVKRGAFALVYLFVAAAGLMLLKPIFADGLCSQALFNSGAMFILLWNVLVLVALLELSFKVGPIIIDDAMAGHASNPPRPKNSARTSASKTHSAVASSKSKVKPPTRATKAGSS